MKFQTIPLERIKIKKNHDDDIKYPEHFIVVEELKGKEKFLGDYYLLLRGIKKLKYLKKDGFGKIGCLVISEHDAYRNIDMDPDSYLFTIVADEREEALKLLFPSANSYMRILFLLKNVGGEVV